MVSIEDIDQAQMAWGDGIVKIAKAHRDGGDYVGLAENHIKTLYAYDQGKVLFKPTLATVEQFRDTPSQHSRTLSPQMMPVLRMRVSRSRVGPR